jgi:hypothetical protein
MEKLIDELGQIQQYQLRYPAQRAKGPGRVATVVSKQSIPQHWLAETLGLDQLGSGIREQYTLETINLFSSIG